jgi:hypothetical protein
VIAYRWSVYAAFHLPPISPDLKFWAGQKSVLQLTAQRERKNRSIRTMEFAHLIERLQLTSREN